MNVAPPDVADLLAAVRQHHHPDKETSLRQQAARVWSASVSSRRARLEDLFHDVRRWGNLGRCMTDADVRAMAAWGHEHWADVRALRRRPGSDEVVRLVHRMRDEPPTAKRQLSGGAKMLHWLLPEAVPIFDSHVDRATRRVAGEWRGVDRYERVARVVLADAARLSVAWRKRGPSSVTALRALDLYYYDKGRRLR